MQRLIDADALKQKVNAAYDLYEYESRNDFYRVIDNAPTIDAIPVEWLRMVEKNIPQSVEGLGVRTILNLWEANHEREDHA